MMGMIDGMIYGVGEFKDRDTYLHKCREILEEQSALVQSILAISKMEMGTEVTEEVFSLKQVLEENLQLDIDDFVGNIRPDSHFAEKLDLDIFKNSVDQHSYFVKSFSNFSNDEKTIICKFIKKAINLYEYDDYVDDLFIFLRPKIKVVISTFVRKLFQTDDPRNIQNQLLQMEKFNSIELEELEDILIDVINEVSIKELATDNDKINSKLADDFQHQIVIANTKKV